MGGREIKSCQNCKWLQSQVCYPLEVTEEGVVCRGRIYGAGDQSVPRFSTRERMQKVR